MNPRELAVELMGLESRERERLLAELPAPRRAEMVALMREAGRASRDPAPGFEAHLQDAERAQRRDVSFDHLNDGQLRLLLSAEQPSVQQRIIAAVRSGDMDSWPPSVRRVVLAWLRSRQHSSSVPLSAEVRTKPERPWSRWHWPWQRKRA